MTITTLSSREFNQHAGRAKKAAKCGPVFITDRGQPEHVLLSFEEYRRLVGERKKIGDLLAMPGIEEIDFTPAKLDEPAKAAEFE
ncbi:type II toxin-antitoxin system Phd/YefM family antitoxin [Pelovirga terrestris]|uniref:Antitoxin n=1 Tax=Pelovirga terrestris TaxID=2771352 RepID=A0A8J6QLW3_9BACT|nr:type II toxin-antitoxin system Phd/YefM family antitoxin [Pelovirga terrestris]MBD1400894.1 type II toxin-antitoxin system Phd/YefM family antitoxin [Pelovirga terrestris]